MSDIIYLDNAATTYPKPPSVISVTNKCIKKYCGNPGRSSHRLSVMAAEAIYSCREKISELLSFQYSERIVFTLNATYALNMALKSVLSANDHVIISDLEHNSVIRPLERLKNDLGLTYTVFSTDGSVDDIKKSIISSITDNTKAIVTTIASNVTGKTIPLDMLSKIRKAFGLILIVDASQYIGHCPIDLSQTPCDILCAPGHKALFGIQGCGFMVVCNDVLSRTFIEGGSGSFSKIADMPPYYPDRYEAGTPPTPSIAALYEGVRYVMNVGFEEIISKSQDLTDLALDRLSEFKHVKIYGAQTGIISFNFSNITSSVVASELDKCGICVRSGLHCAPIIHKKLGTDQTGAVRVSLSCLNSKRDIDKLYRALKEVNTKYF